MMTFLNRYSAFGFSLVLALANFSAWATPATSYFIYDEQGHVVGEYDANGNPIQEHVYLGDRPVAVVQGGSVDYVSTDQLYTPRVVTDASQTVVWTWNSDPFGNTAASGSLTYNLRFAGQYFDGDTGHVYNHQRDYDPATDRYVESDPIGLVGGLNTYLYVSANPLYNVDIMGLCPALPDLPERPVGPPELLARYRAQGGSQCWWKMSTVKFKTSLTGMSACQCHKRTCSYTQFKETRVYTFFLECKNHDYASANWGDGTMTPSISDQFQTTESCD